jgi:hypothetical protein
MKPGARSRSQWQTANSILTTATEPTPAALWAMGVYLLGHSIYLAEIWADQHPLDGEYGGGGSIGGNSWRTYEIRSGRLRVKEGGDDQPCLILRTRAIEALVAIGRVPAGLVEAARELHVERRRLSGITQDHNQRYILGENPPDRDEVLAHGEIWADIERRCRDAAADVWEHVRPRQQATQLDLFDLAGGSR